MGRTNVLGRAWQMALADCADTALGLRGVGIVLGRMAVIRGLALSERVWHGQAPIMKSYVTVMGKENFPLSGRGPSSHF